MKKNNNCIDCEKELSQIHFKRCRNCFLIFAKQNKKRYYCKTCKKEISKWSGKYGKGRCLSCAMKHLFKNKTKVPFFGKHHSKETKEKIRKKLKGKKSNLYIHGKGSLPYNPKFTRSLKHFILERDKFKCQVCDMTQKEHLLEYNSSLEVHHIDYDKMNCKENNLITLCKSCHVRTNYNRDYYYAYFTYMIGEINER